MSAAAVQTALSWRAIWARREAPAGAGELARLMLADGFDTAGGSMTEGDWIEQYRRFRGFARVDSGDSIFEVGCGAGAFLLPFYRDRHRVGGIDYSEPLVAIARDALAGGSFRVGEASSLDLREDYDILAANSVFQYFEGLEYARCVVLGMLRGARKRVAILDLPDARLRDECEALRRAALPEGEYEARYEGLGHQYYEREWFEGLAREAGCAATIRNLDIASYGYSPYRFSVALEKPDPGR